ncbi:portal protein [Roseinatronobacter sp. NSM]|uniref:portal protein n=1 Tax=Roseinatronobacter sp. NSM TaxID=3457785 RepID=UPI0040374A01
MASSETRKSAIESRFKQDSPIDRLKTSSHLFGEKPLAAIGDKKLDGEKASNLHDRLISHYLRELDRQADWRARMERDEDFYDSHQWDPDDEQILKDRGQEPMVLNVISQSINWIIGSERRARTDYKILPRKKEASQPAQRKSEILKYLSDANKSQFAFSDAFEEMVKAGLSFMECGVQEDTDGEPIYDRSESWRNIIWDSQARERDLSDARYIFRTKWVDTDTAIAMFPKRKEHIEMSAAAAEEFGGSIDRYGDDAMDAAEYDGVRNGYSSIEHPSATRERVRLIEAWFKLPETTDVMSGGEFTGEIYDELSRGHRAQVESGEAEIRKRLTFRTYVMVMTTRSVLWLSESPYRHNRYPFSPMWCYRRAKTGEPYGVVRNMVDAQKDINKRFSKALAILSSNKTIMDEGAVADIDAYAEEVKNPDAVIVKKAGKELKIDADRELSAAHLSVMQMSMQMIQTLSGVTDEAMGRTTNAVSGRAIMARQEQGAVSTAKPFDALRASKQYHGEKMLSLVEQFMTEEKKFRITNSRGQPDFVTVNNEGMPENDITLTKADYIISDDDWNASLRQAQVVELMELMTQLAPVAPQVVMVLLDLVVEAMDVPSREEIVKRIRNITGMEDPDADPNVPDPERDAREKQKAEAAEMERRMAAAQIAKAEGDAAKSMAQAEKEGANAAKLLQSLPGADIDQKRAALELALTMLASPPQATATADVIQEGAEQKSMQGIAALQGGEEPPVSPEQQAMMEQGAAMAAQEQQPV